MLRALSNRIKSEKNFWPKPFRFSMEKANKLANFTESTSWVLSNYLWSIFSPISSALVVGGGGAMERQRGFGMIESSEGDVEIKFPDFFSVFQINPDFSFIVP